jgi:hypothetical protein
MAAQCWSRFPKNAPFNIHSIVNVINDIVFGRVVLEDFGPSGMALSTRQGVCVLIETMHATAPRVDRTGSTLTGKQRIAIGAPLVLMATMYPAFRFFDAAFGDHLDGYLG